MIKRLFAILMIVAFLPAFYAAAEENSDNTYTKNVNILHSLGILDNIYVQINDENSYLSDGIVNKVIFDFNGYNTGDFESYADITVGTAAAKLMYALGYNYMIDNGKRNDTDYYTAAQNINLLKGITADAGKMLASGDFAKMLVNALYIEQKMGVKNNDEADYISVGTYMGTNNVTKAYGRVEATHETSLTMPKGTSGGKIIISGKTYSVDFDAAKYLGYDVEYYAKEDAASDYEKVLCIFPREYNKSLTIAADDIKDVSSDFGEIRYATTDDKTKTAKISGDFVLIYNGKYKIKKDVSLFKPKIGEITLLDNNGDGRYEMVSIKEYEVYTVDHIYDNTIYDENNKTPLDLSDEKNIRTVKKNGNAASIRQIVAGDIVYATIDAGGEYIEINASDKKINGTVTMLEEADNYMYYTVNGEKYLASRDLKTENILNCSGTFYLGPTGIIEKQEISRKSNYGILLAAAEDNGIGDMKLKIFTSSGKTEVFDLEKNAVLYNGTSNRIKSAQLAELAAYAESYQTPLGGVDAENAAAPIIMYTEGETGIKTVSLPTLYDEENKGSDREKYALQSVTKKDDMLYKRGYNLFIEANRSFNPSNTQSLSDGETKFVNSSTVVFQIPINNGDGKIPSDYAEKAKVYTGDYKFRNWQYGNFYNFDDNRVPEVMVYYKKLGAESEVHGLLVDKNTKALNSNNEECTVISGYKDGEYVSLEVSEDMEISLTRISQLLSEVPEITVESFEKGDYIFVGIDGDGKISVIQPMLLARYENTDYKRIHNDVSYENYGEVVFGEVIDINNKLITVKIDYNLYNSEQLVFYENGYKRTAWGLYEKEKNRVSGRTAEIYKGDYVLIMREKSVVLDMFVRR